MPSFARRVAIRSLALSRAQKFSPPAARACGKTAASDAACTRNCRNSLTGRRTWSSTPNCRRPMSTRSCPSFTTPPALAAAIADELPDEDLSSQQTDELRHILLGLEVALPEALVPGQRPGYGRRPYPIGEGIPMSTCQVTRLTEGRPFEAAKGLGGLSLW